MVGRKAGATSKIGSLPLLAAGQFHLPNIIVKSKAPIVDRPRVFMAAVKDLEHVVPYDLALDLMKPGNGDKLLVVHGYKDTFGVQAELAKFEEYFEDRLVADGLKRNGSAFVPVLEQAGVGR